MWSFFVEVMNKVNKKARSGVQLSEQKHFQDKLSMLLSEPNIFVSLIEGKGTEHAHIFPKIKETVQTLDYRFHK